MYHVLTDRELNVLRHMLFDGTEKAFSVLIEDSQELNSAEYHRELADIFVEAATELSRRLEHPLVAA